MRTAKSVNYLPIQGAVNHVVVSTKYVCNCVWIKHNNIIYVYFFPLSTKFIVKQLTCNILYEPQNATVYDPSDDRLSTTQTSRKGLNIL